MRRGLVAAFLALGTTPTLAAQVIDVAARRPAASGFETLWADYRRADKAGDAEGREKFFREIKRLRVERNIRSLEEIALALVGEGLESLRAGNAQRAEDQFRRAITLDPHLPDGHFGLALTQANRGPLGILQAAKEILSGLRARLATTRGASHVFHLLIPVALLAALAATVVLGLALLLRHGSLLLHDIEEAFGQGSGRSVAVGVYAVLLFFPAITFQGYAWLPLWWLTLLFLYVGRMEKVLILLVLLAAAGVGPLVHALDDSVLAYQNPLFRGGILAMEGGPDARAIADLEQARALRENADDRDLTYLLALQYKKAGRYDEAAALYKDILTREDRNDSVAINNLANIEFARGEYQAAIARYEQVTKAGGPPEFLATFHYNLSLAYNEKFEFQPAAEARSQADRLDGGATRSYESLWKFEKEGSVVRTVVDIGLTREQLWAKFAGRREGVGRKNVAGKPVGGLDGQALLRSALNRLTAFLGVFGIVVLVLSRWRGKKMFTMRCLKCGTPFCKRCHLGAAPSGLCTQCYHLFVVRDGVSGPARNQKLLEVQKEDQRRGRVFRLLSLLSPGAGHLYAQRTLAGIVFVALWYGVLALSLLGGRVLPVTEASAELAKPWPLGLAGLVLLAIYVAANRARADFEVLLPVRRGGPARRGRAA